MAEGITFKITVQDDGTATLEKLDSGFKKFGKTVQSTEQSIGQVATSVKGFAMQIGGAMGMMFGVQGAIEAINLGVQAMQAEESFRKVTEAVGANGDAILAAMKTATAGTIEESDLMQKAVKAISLDIPPEKLAELAETARLSARISGGTVEETFIKIVDAISTNVPRGLKQLGLITKEEMGLFNKCIAEGVEGVSLLSIVLANHAEQQAKFGELNDNASESMQRLKAEIKEMAEDKGKKLAGFFLAMMHPLESFAKIWKNIADEVKRAKEGLKDLSPFGWEERHKEAMKKQFEAQGELPPGMQKAIDEADYSGWNVGGPGVSTKTQAEIMREELAKKEAEKKKLEAQKKLDAQLLSDKMQMWNEMGRKEEEAMWKVDYEEPIKKQKKVLEDWYKSQKGMLDEKYGTMKEAAERESNIYDAHLAVRQAQQEIQYEKDVEEMEKWVKLTERTANAMEDNFSNFFFDIFTGKITTMGDLAKRVFQSIQRAAADYLGQSLTEGIFGSKTKEGGREGGIIKTLFGQSGGGGLAAAASWLGGLVGIGGGPKAGTGTGTAGNTAVPYVAMDPYAALGAGAGTQWYDYYHRGGVVGETVSRMMGPIGLLAGAMRLHRGLNPDEYPSILQRGETVLRRGAKSLTINVPITTNAGGARLASALRTEIEGTVEKVIRRHT